MQSDSLVHLFDLASGGMGRVEVAMRKEAHFERLFAVKRLHAHFAADTAARTMFLDEARIAGLIRHPNVVHVVDVGHDEAGSFLVMEYVEGLPLSRIISDGSRAGVQLPLSVAYDIVRQAALGLQAAHELVDSQGDSVGLIHRDVSPQNILVSHSGCARLTDFGIAKASDRFTKTQTGVLKGKMGYFSPEQLRFEELTQRADLFSLGVVLFETLSAKRLYGGGGVSAARRILHEPPPDLADIREDVSPAVIGLLFRLLAKDPEHRALEAKDVAEVLETAIHELPEEQRESVSEFMLAEYADAREARRDAIATAIQEHGEETAAALRRASTLRRRIPWAIALIALVAGVAGAGFGVTQLVADDPPSDDPAPIAVQFVPREEIATPTPAEPEPAPEPVVPAAEAPVETPSARPRRARRRAPQPERPARRSDGVLVEW
ncbi:MAG: serine/threonine-protein kinase [Sandaracinaceae bacterium]